MRAAPRAFTAWDALLAAALAGACLAFLVRPAPPAALTAEVTSGAGTRAIGLEAGRRIDVSGPLGTTVVELDRGGARIASSPCPNQLCVKAGRISRPGQVAACLPNRVAVRLLGRSGNREGVDAVAR